MMSLWCVFRSPLIMGGELRENDDFTLSLLTNKEILRMHRKGENAHQVYRSDRACVWKSRDCEDGSVYVALFNLSDEKAPVTAEFSDLGLEASYAVRDLWTHQDLGEEDQSVQAFLPPHGAAVYRLQQKEGSGR